MLFCLGGECLVLTLKVHKERPEFVAKFDDSGNGTLPSHPVDILHFLPFFCHLQGNYRFSHTVKGVSLFLSF